MWQVKSIGKTFLKRQTQWVIKSIRGIFYSWFNCCILYESLFKINIWINLTVYEKHGGYYKKSIYGEIFSAVLFTVVRIHYLGFIIFFKVMDQFLLFELVCKLSLETAVFDAWIGMLNWLFLLFGEKLSIRWVLFSFT